LIVFDRDGREAAHCKFGQPLSLPEGKYRMKTAYAGSEMSADFAIATDTMTSVLFDASRITAHASASDHAPLVTPGVPASATPRFCTRCGNPLPAGAKFCPKCGQPVKQ
jgi:membrane protease subunit (stomatin/prohibitin family)